MTEPEQNTAPIDGGRVERAKNPLSFTANGYCLRCNWHRDSHDDSKCLPTIAERLAAESARADAAASELAKLRAFVDSLYTFTISKWGFANIVGLSGRRFSIHFGDDRPMITGDTPLEAVTAYIESLATERQESGIAAGGEVGEQVLLNALTAEVRGNVPHCVRSRMDDETALTTAFALLTFATADQRSRAIKAAVEEFRAAHQSQEVES